MVSGSELPLKLARKCVDVFGTSLFDDDSSIHTLHTGCDEETAFITAGKDFGLIRTGSGKVNLGDFSLSSAPALARCSTAASPPV
ncbi:unnamed protein product [Timema podura]|uniref:Uncharacterized protein n=1 Tax=Timema podura TaxID=61482 RepID=A0ABN7PSU4_TIMPD|nr:unnamed protein product [Timema podura]